MPETVELCAQVDRLVLTPILDSRQPEFLVLEGAQETTKGLTFRELVQARDPISPGETEIKSHRRRR